MKIFSASIDLTKIDKSKIVNHKNGAQYYPIDIVVKDDKDQYGNDCAISNSQTKEEREAKERKTYLGNGKSVWDSNAKKSEDDLPY